MCTVARDFRYRLLLQGRSCGQNMVFITVHKFDFQNDEDSNYFHCIVKCVCANGYYEKNAECIKRSSILSANAYNPVSKEGINNSFIPFFNFSVFTTNMLLIRLALGIHVLFSQMML